MPWASTATRRSYGRRLPREGHLRPGGNDPTKGCPGPRRLPVRPRNRRELRGLLRPNLGRFKDITHPVLGNHEGGEGGTNTTYFDYFGPSAGDRTHGSYSFDLGAWHLIALDSNCGTYSFNHSHDECAAGSAQDTWLKNDLATNPAMCTLAYFHVQRFVPLTPAGQIDQAHGIREFIVGTGGDDHHTPGAAVHGSEVRNSDSFGVLRLTLRSSSYDYQFVNDGTPGATNTDHGSAQCHQ
jgi:hypothetical protein